MSTKPLSVRAPRTNVHSVINGEESRGDHTIALVDPSTGNEWGEVTWALSQLDSAVQGAVGAQREWALRTESERADVLEVAGRLLAQYVEDLAVFESLANGKPLHATRAEVQAASKWWQYYAALLRSLRSESWQITGTKEASARHEPVGVVGLITPFNGAFSLGVWKLVPALAAGNGVVLKPPANSPASSVLLRQIAVDAGVPEALIQIVQGPAEVGAAVAAHPQIDMVSFTGSTRAARSVGATVAGRLGRFVAEAGGKSAHIIFDDVDIEQAVTAVVQGAFSGSGQTCVAGSRVFVHREVEDSFTERLLARVERLQVGDPIDESVHLGPIATQEQRDRIISLINQAVDDGAEVLTGGVTVPQVAPHLAGGFWVKPTVLKTVSNQEMINQTEVFGPVIGIQTFDTESEVVDLANDTEFGLAAGVWTGSATRAKRMGRSLQAGTVWINTYRGMDWQTPFGGFKQSGIGRENGIEGLREFQQLKAVVEDSERAPDPFGLERSTETY